MPTGTVVDEKLRYGTQGDAADQTIVCCSLARRPVMGLGLTLPPTGAKVSLLGFFFFFFFTHTTAVDR